MVKDERQRLHVFLLEYAASRGRPDNRGVLRKSVAWLRTRRNNRAIRASTLARREAKWRGVCFVLAATSPKKIKNSSLLSVSLSNLAEELARLLSQGRLLPRALYSERYSLRLSAKLITGLWVLYRKKAAALRAKAEECLRLLTTRKRPRDQSIDLSSGAAEGGKKGGRRKRKGSPVPPLADTEPPSAHFGKVLLKEETPEELIVARLPPVPADTLTADLESITLREEVPLRMDPLGLDDDAFQEEITMEPVEGDDVMEELERLVALHGISSRAREDTTFAATQQEEGQPPEGRPVSPIVPRFSRGGTPPPRRLPSDLVIQEAGGEPAAAPERYAEPVAVPPPPAQQQPLDEAVAGPSGLTPPLRRSPGGGRRRQAVSPPAGPGPKRRRRRRGPVVDRETQISMEEMRANMQANNQRGRPDAFQNLAKLLCGPDVEALFRLPGRRLLSERLLRPWKLARTRPEPDEEEPLGEGEPAGGVQHSPARERRQEAEAREELSLAPPREGSLEVGREPSASSSGLEAGIAGTPSVASLLADIQEEEGEQQPGGVVTAEPLVPIPEEMLPQEQEEALLEEELLGHGAVGASPGAPDGPVMGASCSGGMAAASSSQLQEPGRMGSLWNRLQEVSDAHGMCTLESLVPPDAFNRRSVAGSFATLLRMHKRGMVHMEQFNAYGPVVVTVLKEDQGTPPLDEPQA
ncbi:uncharacterized protein LOC144158542 [Haemaphysalis longicornis]